MRCRCLLHTLESADVWRDVFVIHVHTLAYRCRRMVRWRRRHLEACIVSGYRSVPRGIRRKYLRDLAAEEGELDNVDLATIRSMAGVDAMVEGKTVKVSLRHEQTGLNSNHVDRSRGLHFSQFSQPVEFGMWGWVEHVGFLLDKQHGRCRSEIEEGRSRLSRQKSMGIWMSASWMTWEAGKEQGMFSGRYIVGLVCKRGVYQCSPRDKVLSFTTIPCKDVNQRRLRSTYKPRTSLSKEEHKDEAPQASRSTDPTNPRFWHLFRHDF